MIDDLSEKEHEETINGIKTQTYLRYFELWIISY